MKNTIALTVALLSLSAHSAVELYGKDGNTECKIAKDSVTVTTTFQKGTFGFTTVKPIQTFGIDKAVKAAAAASTGRTMTTEVSFSVKVDDTVSTLHFDDSKEAQGLIQFIAKNCF